MCCKDALSKPKKGSQNTTFAANNPSRVALTEPNQLSLTSTRILDFVISFETGQFVREGPPP